MADFKRLNFTSPKGTYVFPKLNEPDTKFDADGVYTVKLSLPADAPATQAFIAQLAPLHAQAVAAAEAEFKAMPIANRKKLEAKGGVQVNDFFSTAYDRDTEKPTGMIEFNFKLPAKVTNKKTGKVRTFKPVIYDAKGMSLKNPPEIWGGTVGKVAFTVLLKDGVPGYFIPGSGAAGITLSLEAVQIIELRSGQSRSAAGMGFDKEDGFDGSSSEFADTTGDTATSTSDDADF